MKRYVFLAAVSIAVLASQASAQFVGIYYLPNIDIKFARIEARLKQAAGSGFVNTFYLISAVAEENNWWEMDFVETVGARPYGFETVFHIDHNQTWQTDAYRYSHHNHPFNLYEDYHTYWFEWAPYYVAFGMDNKTYRILETRQDGSLHDQSWSCGHPQYDSWGDFVHPAYQNWIEQFRTGAEDMKLDITCWQGCNPQWCGELPTDGSTCGNAYIMSWFRYYDYTPEEGHGGSDWTLVDWDHFDGRTPTVDDSVTYSGVDTTRWFNAMPWDSYVMDGKFVGVMDCQSGTRQWPLGPYTDFVCDDSLVCTRRVLPVPVDAADTGDVSDPYYTGPGALFAGGATYDKDLTIPTESLVSRSATAGVPAMAIHGNDLILNSGTAGNVAVKLYDLCGRQVRSVWEGSVGAGIQRISLGLNTLPRQTYVVRVDGSGLSTEKIVVSAGSR